MVVDLGLLLYSPQKERRKNGEDETSRLGTYDDEREWRNARIWSILHNRGGGQNGGQPCGRERAGIMSMSELIRALRRG